MKNFSIVPFAISMLILAAITCASQFRWLKPGRVQRAIVFTTGIAIVLVLRIGGIPPWWFAGEGEGFGLAVSLLAWGFVSDRAPDARDFGPPLLYAMALTLLVLNGVAFVLERL
jgi:hypothetical protein